MNKKGFSLAEILISIGILAIGLSMAAAIFPTALKEFERSHNQVMGNLICENALATGKVVLRADDGDNSNNKPYEILDSTTSLEDKTSVLGANANTYPTGDPNSPLGFFLFARKLGEVYQITAVSYRKKDINNKVMIQNVNCNIAADGLMVTGNNLIVGSPLLIRGNGEFAKLVFVDDTGTSGTLDRKLTPGNNLPCFVFKSNNNSTTSPALFALTTRTGLYK